MQRPHSTRLGWLRRKGLDQAAIEAELQLTNARRCVPPLPEGKVAAIAASVARYPVGGLDPLETAWQAAQATGTTSGYEAFIRLAVALQMAREGLEVALPLQRIAALFGIGRIDLAFCDDVVMLLEDLEFAPSLPIMFRFHRGRDLKRDREHCAIGKFDVHLTAISRVVQYFQAFHRSIDQFRAFDNFFAHLKLLIIASSSHCVPY